MEEMDDIKSEANNELSLSETTDVPENLDLSTALNAPKNPDISQNFGTTKNPDTSQNSDAFKNPNEANEINLVVDLVNNNLVQGFIMSEILGYPKGKKRRGNSIWNSRF
jgi:hypothetical protein